jgi:tetratricopeptide (TPR) repeat protein
LGVLFYRKGDHQTALEWDLKALTVLESVLGDAHPSTASAYNNIGSVYFLLGDYPKALDWQLKSFRILLDRLGENHPTTKTIRENTKMAFRNTAKEMTFNEWLSKSL